MQAARFRTVNLVAALRSSLTMRTRRLLPGLRRARRRTRTRTRSHKPAPARRLLGYNDMASVRPFAPTPTAIHRSLRGSLTMVNAGTLLHEHDPPASSTSTTYATISSAVGTREPVGALRTPGQRVERAMPHAEADLPRLAHEARANEGRVWRAGQGHRGGRRETPLWKLPPGAATSTEGGPPSSRTLAQT